MLPRKCFKSLYSESFYVFKCKNNKHVSISIEKKREENTCTNTCRFIFEFMRCSAHEVESTVLVRHCLLSIRHGTTQVNYETYETEREREGLRTSGNTLRDFDQ